MAFRSQYEVDVRMNAVSRTESVSASAKAICYRCSYVGTVVGQARCPACDFPLIQEVGRGPEVAPTVNSLFDRVSVRVGAPPLPGVDQEPRKAQLLMQARRKRKERALTRERVERAERARTEARHRRTATAVAFVSALAAGFVAAVLMSGAL